MAAQPLEFFVEGGGEFHGGGCDVDFEFFGQFGDGFGAAGQRFWFEEEAFFSQEVAGWFFAVRRDGLVDGAAVELVWFEVFREEAVVGGDVNGCGIGEDFVHVEGEAGFHGPKMLVLSSEFGCGVGVGVGAAVG